MIKRFAIFFTLALLMNASLSFGQIAGAWKLVGPINFPYDSSYWQINGIGRIEQIKFDPLNPIKVYATSSGGGLFVSNDSCHNWQSTGTDSAGLGNPDGAAASVCIDYTNDHILYLSTGDINYYSENYGIWKSTNAGATWTISNNGIGNRMAVEIIMSPSDHNTLIAATDNGIWKTTNAGASWTEKLDSGRFTDMKFKPNALTCTIYAASYSDFYVSRDMGETWTLIPLPSPQRSLQGGGRIGVTKADTNMVFVTYVGNDSALCTPVLKSDNSGMNFYVVKPADSCDLNGYDTNNYGQYYQGNYNYCLIVSPIDTNTIYIGAESIWKSTDGGVHWSTSFRWWQGVHTDMHYFAFNPLNSRILYNANDGGVWKTTDSNKTWYPASNGLSATEFYHAASSPINKNFIAGGTQDNGGLFYDNMQWDTFVGGDYTSEIGMNETDSTLFYDLRGDYSEDFITDYNWINLPQRDSTHFHLAAFPPSQTNTAFVADSDIYRTVNLHGNPPVWQKISGFNTPLAAIASSPVNANVLFAADYNRNFYYTKNALSPSPVWSTYTAPGYTFLGAQIAPVKSDSNVIYMSCGNAVYRSRNRGLSWTNVTANLPLAGVIGMFNDYYTSNDAIYLATPDAVWYRDTTMNSWLNFSKGLPNTSQITNLMQYDDGSAGSVVRVSFYGRGIWESPTYRALLLSVAPVSTGGQSIKVYPNPNRGTFTVNIQNFKEGSKIEIFDLLGKNVYAAVLKNDNTVINMNARANGIYIYRITTQGGDFLACGKLVVEQ